MLLSYELTTNIEINTLSDLIKLKNLTDHTSLGILVLKYLCFQYLKKRKYRKPEPFTTDRWCMALYTAVTFSIIKLHAVSSLVTATFPADKRSCQPVLCGSHLIQRTIFLSFHIGQILVDWITHVQPPYDVFMVRSSMN